MNPYSKLARKVVEKYIKEGREITLPSNLPPEMFDRQAGVFVTIYNGPKLRGCIGTFLPTTENIAQEIRANALAACSRDFRFQPITPEELAELSYEVSILTEPEAVAGLDDLDPKKYGVIVRTASGKSGLLLPDLADVDEVKTQVEIACQKGGINFAEESPELYRFETIKYK